MKITAQIFESYLPCKLKAFLRLAKESGQISNFEKSNTEFRTHYFQKSAPEFLEREGNGNSKICESSNLGEGYEFLFKPVIESGDLSAQSDILKQLSGKSALGSFYYIPIRFSPFEKSLKFDTLLLGFIGLILEQL